jgi:hypothetical protein
MITNLERSLAPVVLASFAPLATPGGLVVGESEVDWAGGLERFVGTAATKARVGLTLAMVAFFFAPMWALGRFRTLAASSAEERAAAMERVLAHPIFLVREMGLLVKLVACMAMFRVGSLRARSGYDGPARREEKPSLRVLAA